MNRSNDDDALIDGVTPESHAATPQSTPEESAPTVVAPPPSPASVVLDPSPFDAADLPERYARRKRLGEGGMGEVLLLRDGWIGRDVAMKFVRGGHGSRSDARSRFLREARIQGQLEHPSVVPVYDLGRNAKGELYFTMKRVKGMTLAEIIDGLQRDQQEVTSRYSTRQLLGALSHVCLTVAFAHARGVVHRDLKPSNIMLGDFGEVYVLDWGIAKVAGAADATASPRNAVADEPAQVTTEAGALIGTPGYMAPEQVRSETVDARTDIYALGAILFELLALEPLHGGSVLEKLTASLAPLHARPSRRTSRVVPPELDDVCVRATAFDPGDRYESARQMHEVIERYLDGERDVDRRREAARAAVSAAEAALARVASGGPTAEADRSTAVRELGRALAFDPSHEGALRALGTVLLDASAELPPDAEAELAEVNRLDRGRALRVAALAYATCGLFAPMLIWMGVRRMGWFVTLCTATFVLSVQSWWLGSTGRTTPLYMRSVILLGFVGIALFSTLFGPLIVVPALATLSVASFIVNLRANRITRAAIVTGGVLSVVVPLALQTAGVLPHPYLLEQGRLVVLPSAVAFPPAPTLIVLLLAALLVIVFAGVLAGNAVEALTSAERRLFAQAWRLRQLLPDPALEAVRSPAIPGRQRS
jgi:serine/threonine-protein kinase